MRDSVKVVTIELEAESEGELSIDKAVRQFRKKGREERRDTFLFEMEEKLSTLYGPNESL